MKKGSLTLVFHPVGVPNKFVISGRYIYRNEKVSLTLPRIRFHLMFKNESFIGSHQFNVGNLAKAAQIRCFSVQAINFVIQGLPGK